MASEPTKMNLRDGQLVVTQTSCELSFPVEDAGGEQLVLL